MYLYRWQEYFKSTVPELFLPFVGSALILSLLLELFCLSANCCSYDWGSLIFSSCPVRGSFLIICLLWLWTTPVRGSFLIICLLWMWMTPVRGSFFRICLLWLWMTPVRGSFLIIFLLWLWMTPIRGSFLIICLLWMWMTPVWTCC